MGFLPKHLLTATQAQHHAKQSHETLSHDRATASGLGVKMLDTAMKQPLDEHVPAHVYSNRTCHAPGVHSWTPQAASPATTTGHEDRLSSIYL